MEEDLGLHRQDPGTPRNWKKRIAQEARVAARVQHSVLSASIVARALGRLGVLERRLRLWAEEPRDGDPAVYEEVERLGTGESEVLRRASGRHHGRG